MKKKRIVSSAAVAVLAMAFFVGGAAPATQAALATNMSADIVIGQPDFSSHSSNQGVSSPAANTIALANGVWSDGKKLIVADLYNSRVLIYNNIPTAVDASADVVIGQPDMSTGTAGPLGTMASNRLYIPYSVYSDGIRLFITDTANNRVLIYNSIPTTNGASADVVVGQADMSSHSANQGGDVGANTLLSPYSVYSDGTKLFVADSGNSRILVYNSIPTANGASADFVIGQADFTSHTANQGENPGANTLAGPTSVFAHSGKLFVADDNNNRILIFNTIPTTIDASANVVVGQAAMDAREVNQGGSSPGPNTISDPISVNSDGTRLFVSERDNNRVSVFNVIPTSSNASADYVIGQPDFTSNSANQGGSAAGANTLNTNGSAYFAAGKLIVGDAINARVVIFSVDAAYTWQNNKSKTLYGGIKGRLTKKSMTFSGKKVSAKKGRVYVYRNGVLKKTVKLKKNGSWKLSFAEKQRSANALYQFRFYSAANQLVGVSDQFNVYLAANAKKKTLNSQFIEQSVSNPAPSGNSGKTRFQKNNPPWPDLKL